MKQPKFPIVKPYLPRQEKYQQYVDGIFSRNYLTNNGPLLRQLEDRLAEYLGVEHLLLVANGTLALNVAYAALNVTGKVLTTPFSFAATASSLKWQKIAPVFIDIDKNSLNLDTNQITNEQAQSASAILPVHVFGNPCQVEQLAKIAQQHNLKLIYDAAHAFASKYNDESLLMYGDAATLSLHATKLFHSVEGGAIIFKEKAVYEKAKKIINFGFDENNHPQYIGINAKMSEFHAAMGLAVLDDIAHITDKRKLLVKHYQRNLNDCQGITLQQWHEKGANNGAYMPILLQSEQQLLSVSEQLKVKGIQTRRYFYPSLSKVEIYGSNGDTPVCNELSSRILCLPMYTDLTVEDVDYICQQVKSALANNSLGKGEN